MLYAALINPRFTTASNNTHAKNSTKKRRPLTIFTHSFIIIALNTKLLSIFLLSLFRGIHYFTGQPIEKRGISMFKMNNNSLAKSSMPLLLCCAVIILCLIRIQQSQ